MSTLWAGFETLYRNVSRYISKMPALKNHSSADPNAFRARIAASSGGSCSIGVDFRRAFRYLCQRFTIARASPSGCKLLTQAYTFFPACKTHGVSGGEKEQLRECVLYLFGAG